MRTLLLAAIASSFLVLVACGEEAPPPQTPPPPPTASAPPPPAPPPEPTPPPPPPKPSMTDLQNAAFQGVADALNGHDAQKYASLFATDGVVKVAGMPDLTGREAIAASIQPLLTAVPDLKFAISRTLEKGNVAVSTWAWVGTDSVGMHGAKPTARAIGINGTTVTVFNDDGLVKEARIYNDHGTIAAQLNAKAKKGSFRLPPMLATSTETVAAGGPDEDKNLAATKPIYQAVDDHKVADLCAPFGESAPLDDFTEAAPVAGAKGCTTYVNRFFKAIPDVHQLPLTNQWAIGSYVVSEGVLQGTQKGPLGTIKASGKPIAFHFIDVVQWKDGKLVGLQTYGDSVELLTQIGAIKPPKPAGK